MLFSTSSSLAHHQHPRTRLHTHPQHARTHHHCTPSVSVLSLFHAQPPALLPLPSYLAARTAFFFFLRQGSHPFPGRPFFPSFCFALRQPLFLSACSALRRAPYPPASKNTLAQPRHARPQAKTRKQKHARSALASAHTDDRRTDEATCGPQAWLTGSLHYGGIRSVRSPLRRAPLLATPIAKPLQCGRP